MILIVTTFAATAHAQNQPPEIRAIKPAVVLAGASVPIAIEGKDLDRVASIVFEDRRYSAISATIVSSKPERIEATIAIPGETMPGSIGFRVVSLRGLSNLAKIELARVGPIVAEVEPNDGFRKPQVVPSPCTIDGRIQDGNEVDVFAVDVKEGETLVAEAVAARSGSTLDASLTIFSPDRRELASADDTFGKDAAASAKASKSGRYYVQIAEANGKSGDGKVEGALQGNRVYRLAIGIIPLLTGVDPPGLRRGVETRLRLLGANVPAEATIAAPIDAPIGDFSLRIAGSNPLMLRLGDSPEFREAEPDDAADRALAISAPAVIHGRFERKSGGDVDHYRIAPKDGMAGDYAITCYSARIGSPADPVLAIVGEDAKAVAEDDDKLGRDARIERRIEPGGVLLAVRDYYGRGGERFAYRIEIEPAAKLWVNVGLDARTVPRRGRIAVPIEVERKGFDGPIAIEGGPLPEGVSASPLTITPGSKNGLLILSASENAPMAAFRLSPRVKDGPGPVDWGMIGAKGAESGSESTGDWAFATAEEATIDVRVEPGELAIKPGGESDLKLIFERRGEAAKGPIKVAIRVSEGDPSGLELPGEQTIEAGAIDRVIKLKIKGDAPGGVRSIVASARFESSPPGREIVSAPIRVEVKP